VMGERIAAEVVEEAVKGDAGGAVVDVVEIDVGEGAFEYETVGVVVNVVVHNVVEGAGELYSGSRMIDFVVHDIDECGCSDDGVNVYAGGTAVDVSVGDGEAG